MQAVYEVKLTTTALEIYQKFYQEAEACIKTGNKISQKVARLKLIDRALNEDIHLNPFNPRLRLAGCLSIIHVLCLDQITIPYVPDADTRTICVLYIGTRKPQTHLAQLQQLVESGKINSILQNLGIDATGILDSRYSSSVH